MPYKDPAMQKAALAKYKAKWTAILRRYKTLKGCTDCGYREHWAALEFDHLGDKAFNIGRRGVLGKQKLKDELAKCEVVCANCHNIRTHKRRKNMVYVA